jgi:hypothetical protein
MSPPVAELPLPPEPGLPPAPLPPTLLEQAANIAANAIEIDPQRREATSRRIGRGYHEQIAAFVV